tara:strand:+ start:37 stop:417 length:381 start_codon:yes stop_codon:yes gene_type:complete
MANYAWTINKLYTKDVTKNGTTYNDAILRIDATLKGTSETIGSISAEGNFDLDMNVDNIDSDFTAYNSVTEANVKTWVENRIDSKIFANVKAEIEAEIKFQENVDGSSAKGSTNSEGVFTASFPWS